MESQCCKATVTATYDRNSEEIKLRFSGYDASVIHEGRKKRRLRFENRQKAAESLKTDTAYAVRSQIADNLMRKDDDVPGHLPTLNTLRKVRSEIQKQDLPHEHPVLSIQMMKKESVYSEYIGRIGLDPFFVFYATHLQKEWYSAEFRGRRSVLSLDATGLGLLSPNTVEKKYVFLYSAVAHGMALIVLYILNDVY